MKRLDEKMFVSGQILPGEIPTIAAAGVAMIVNNRPDGEEPGQPAAEEIARAARIAGLDYRHIPISTGFHEDKVTEMGEALAAARGPVLAFCKSGTRSTFLWGMARARAGESAAPILAKAAAAGYDLRAIRPYLRGEFPA
jgi:uncharacterized protein (TIGR01244 family)